MKFHTEQTNRTLPILTCSELFSFPTLLKYSFTVILDFSFSWTITGFIRIGRDDLGQFLLWSQLQASENYAEKKNSSKLKSQLNDNWPKPFSWNSHTDVESWHLPIQEAEQGKWELHLLVWAAQHETPICPSLVVKGGSSCSVWVWDRRTCQILSSSCSLWPQQQMH